MGIGFAGENWSLMDRRCDEDFCDKIIFGGILSL